MTLSNKGWSMAERPKKTQRNTFHSTRYAYHETGHAVVGHVIGRCIAEISIKSDRTRGYKGYCAFDAFAEDVHGFPQWRDGSKNPECISILYAGTVAFKILSEQRGWKYEHWRGSEKADFDTIFLWSLEMFPARDEDEKRQALYTACRQQAEHILTSNWCAVEALATALLKDGRLTGNKAHAIIQQALGETGHDWRLENGRVLDYPIEY